MLLRQRQHQLRRSASEAYLAENHDARSRRQSVIFEEPPSGGFSRAIWLEYANQQTFKGDESGELPHEVRLFLSYPPEDVKGFIDHRANNFKCAGLNLVCESVICADAPDDAALEACRALGKALVE